MQKRDEAKFAEQFVGLCEYFDKPFSQALLDIYWRGLEDLSIEQFESAVTVVIRSAKWFPKISELRELAHGNPDERAIAAWEQVKEAIARGGYVSSVVFEDSKITRAIEHIGGWVKLCMAEGKDAKFMQKDFMAVYKALTDGGPQRKLIGADEADNRFLGFTDHIPEPLVIGSEKFLLWHRDMLLEKNQWVIGE